MPELYYPDVVSFVTKHLAPMYRRSLSGNSTTWCPRCWQGSDRPRPRRASASIATSANPCRRCGSRRTPSRALGNLLDNALRETPAGGTVHVEMTADRGAVSVAVRDECGGIPDDRRSLLLTGPRPAAAGSTSRAGLGLAIARGLLAAHDATLTVRNEASGCRFETSIPIREERPR